jgi:hypothetical protein
MKLFLDVLFLISLFSMVIVYPMYFIELSNFRRILLRQHSDLLKVNETGITTSNFDLSGAYRVIKGIRNEKFAGVLLSAEALRSHKHTKNLLYLGTFLFMTTLLLGLAEAIISKHG